MPIKKTAIRKQLLDEGLINKEQYEETYLETMENGDTFCHHLVEKGLIDSQTLFSFMGHRFKLTQKNKEDLRFLPTHILKKVSFSKCKKYRILPISVKNNRLLLGMTDPTMTFAVEDVKKTSGMEVDLALISEKDMDWVLSKYCKKDGTPSFRDTLPFALSENKEQDWQDSNSQEKKIAGDKTKRSTLSFGISIEDAIVSATHEFGQENRLSDFAENQRNNEISKEEREENLLKTDSEAGEVSFAILENQSLPSITPTLSGFFSKAPSILPLPFSNRKKTEGELLHSISTTLNKNDILTCALEYLLRFSKRSVFFVVKKDRIKGYLCAGESKYDSTRSFWIPFNKRSTLGQVAISGQLYMGPIGKKPADDVFCAALGGRPFCALFIPLIIKNKTVGILFADKIKPQEISWPRVAKLTDTVTSALVRMLYKSLGSKNAKG